MNGDELTLRAPRDLRGSTEEQISRLIRDFESSTGLSVDDLSLDRTRAGTGKWQAQVSMTVQFPPEQADA